MRRNRIDHVAKLSLAPAGSFRPLLNFLESFLQFNPGLRLFGDIYCGPNKFQEVALLVHDGTSDRMLVFDGSVGKKKAVVRFVISMLHDASLKQIPNPLPILRMNPANQKSGLEQSSPGWTSNDRSISGEVVTIPDETSRLQLPE